MKLWLKRGQKGFTLVELMVVMAILAVLSTIVFTAVSGTSETSSVTQTKQDAGTVNAAVNDYYGDQTGAEVFTTNTTSILSGTANIAQVITSRWPEKYLTVAYLAEFPLASDNISGQAVSGNVTIITVDSTGTPTSPITPKTLAEGWNAINLSTLVSGKYIPALPRSGSDLQGSFHNYLWLMRKTTTTAGGATAESRKVEVFKLTSIVQSETTKNYTLTYKQIY